MKHPVLLGGGSREGLLLALCTPSILKMAGPSDKSREEEKQEYE